MNLLHQPEDAFMRETLEHIAMWALESTGSNKRIDFGSASIACTANTTATTTVNFNRIFKSGTTPIVLLFANPATASSRVTPSYANLTNSSFTAQVNTDTTQNVDINYIAIG